MSRFLTSACVVLLTLLVADAAQAAVVTIDGTVKSVDAKKRTITVQTKTKTLELDVSRKAKVSVKGKTAKLDSLAAGQKVKISYHDGLEIVLKIEAISGSVRSPRLVDVSELKPVFAPFLSENGLTIYWERRERDKKPMICTAHRKNVDSFFEGEKTLFSGKQPTITNDGLEMILVGSPTPDSKCFYSTTRDIVEESFRRPKPIPELRDPPGTAWSRDASFSHDGLTLYFIRYPRRGVEIAFVVRPDRKSPWSKPQTLKLAGSNLFPRNPTSPFVTDDGLTLFCIVKGPTDWMKRKGNLLRFTRASLDEGFADPAFVEIEGFPKLVGAFPRYVSVTKELFFLQFEEGNLGGKSRLIIVKNFVAVGPKSSADR